MPTASYLDNAVELVQRAIDEDQRQNYPEAYKLYQNSLDYFMLALKYEKNEKARLLIRTKATEYLSRAETLKDHMLNTPGKKANFIATASRSGSADDNEGDIHTMKPRGRLYGNISSENPNVKWDDVAGHESVKASLQRAVIMPIKFPHLFTGNRTPCKSILLYGPPGTGKSYLAKAIATEAKRAFFRVRSSDLVSIGQGDPDSFFESLFKRAREEKPAIIFIDDIDSLTNESEVSRIKAQLLVRMDSLGDNNTSVLILGATNIPWQLDKAILRRFEKRIYVPLPGFDARCRLFEIHVGSTPCQLQSEDYRTLAKQTNGYSGSDISAVVRNALMQPVHKVMDATHFRQVEVEDFNTGSFKTKWTPCSPGAEQAKNMTWSELESGELLEPPSTFRDFLKCLELNTKPTVTEADLTKYEDWTKEFGNDDA